MAGGALADVAAVVLMLPGGGRVESGRLAERGTGRVKGDAVAFSLVREDGERIDGESGVYRDGDRFKVIVTCPPGQGTSFDVVVFDEGGVSFPLAPAGDFACGNEAPVPGAFVVTGRGNEEVCLLWSGQGSVDRATAARGNDPGAPRLCKTLSPNRRQ